MRSKEVKPQINARYGVNLPKQTVRKQVMRRFKKRPVEIEAFQVSDLSVFPDWVPHKEIVLTSGIRIYIKTLEGEMRVRVEDWVIKGVEGEFYPCKNSIFQKTYMASE